MIGNVVGFLIGLAALVLGGKGFSETGLPLTGKKNITGTPAKVIGVICVVIGLGLMGLALLGIIAAQRR